PSASTTFHPGSITNHETGSVMRQGTRSVTSDRASADVPDRPLRRDRVRVGERAQDLHLAGDAFLVAALEATCRHLGRDAVAEPARAPKLQRVPFAETRRVARREQQRGAFPVVRGPEPPLRTGARTIRTRSR